MSLAYDHDTQFLCPQRHCSIGLLWDDARDTAAEMEDRGQAIYQQVTGDRWCGICGSRDLKAEHQPTRFSAMVEARKVPAARSIDGVSGQYSNVVGEEIPAGEERVLALEGTIRASRLPRHMADPMQGGAVAPPPRNMYGLYNLLTYVSTHHAATAVRRSRPCNGAGDQAEPGHHARYWPTCRRWRTDARPLLR
jgi:hypothetical protein